MAPFDVWAEYYDIIHTGTPGDVEFYVTEALDARGDVLELGVGTGRIALPAALAGVDITGVDNSKAMLVLCREKARLVGRTSGTLRLVLNDMSSFRFRRRFSRILMPYRTFMHLLTQDEQRRCLERIHAHLADDGRLLMNTWAAKPSAIARLLSHRTAGKLKPAGSHRVEEDITLRHFNSVVCDEMRQLLIERHLLQELDNEGRVVQERMLPLVRAWTTRREIENMFRLCGFEVEALYGDFSRDRFTEDSTEMIYVLRKTARRARK